MDKRLLMKFINSANAIQAAPMSGWLSNSVGMLLFVPLSHSVLMYAWLHESWILHVEHILFPLMWIFVYFLHHDEDLTTQHCAYFPAGTKYDHSPAVVIAWIYYCTHNVFPCGQQHQAEMAIWNGKDAMYIFTFIAYKLNLDKTT